MNAPYKLIAGAAAVLLAGCVSVPVGPRVMAMPGSGKDYEQFRQDEAICQNYASQATDGSARQANDSAVNSAAVGTVVGAAAGALIGAASGNAGAGAAIGAGSGLLVGSSAGANNAARGGYGVQRRYDDVYLQCMYARGNQVPMAIRGNIQRAPTRLPPPPPGYVGTPAPGGYNGAPPPDYVPQGASRSAPPAGYGPPPDYVVPTGRNAPPAPGAY